VMSKMIKVLPVFMFFVMVNLPGALALYYAVSNLVAVLQQRFILKQDSEELIELADSAPVPKEGKKATAKARAKVAREGNVIRLTAKDTASKKEASS
jgi:membrane protein insertase Oxa1/YidC/SpoIIIJ